MADRTSTSDNFEPVMLVDRTVGAPEPILGGVSTTGRQYRRVQILVRDDDGPLGQTVVALPSSGLDSEAVAVAMDAVIAKAHAVDGSKRTSHTDMAATVIIATVDRPDQLERCLRSLHTQSHQNFKVIVVENTTHPGQARRVVEQHRNQSNSRTIEYVHEPRRGLANAHNAGLARVDTEVVVFTDDDVEADPAWLAALLSEFVDAPEVACVTGLIYPAILDTETQVLVERLGFGKKFQRVEFDLAEHKPANRLFPFAIGSCGSGANMAFRTEALRRNGGFDGALGTGSPGRGGDDLAAFFDIVIAGYTVVYQPAAIIRHHHNPDELRFRRQVRQYGTGLGAYLTRCMMHHPSRIPMMMRELPAGVRHLLQTHQPASDDEVALPLRPRLAGMVAGPAAYLLGRRALKRRID